MIDVDFTKGLGIYDTIQQKIKGLDIGILVNNVGMGYPGPLHFHELANRDNFLWDIIACNVISISFMTKQVINGMLKKKSGLILNISSIAGTIPLPVCLYSSSKVRIYMTLKTPLAHLTTMNIPYFRHTLTNSPKISTLNTKAKGFPCSRSTQDLLRQICGPSKVRNGSSQTLKCMSPQH